LVNNKGKRGKGEKQTDSTNRSEMRDGVKKESRRIKKLGKFSEPRREEGVAMSSRG
jgi:hypothetical protein